MEISIHEKIERKLKDTLLDDKDECSQEQIGRAHV